VFLGEDHGMREALGSAAQKNSPGQMDRLQKIQRNLYGFLYPRNQGRGGSAQLVVASLMMSW